MKLRDIGLGASLVAGFIMFTPVAAAFCGCGHKHEYKETVIDIAMKDARFSTLVGLIKSAGLEDALREKGTFTVFAPTNAAFAKLPQATLDMLAKAENKDKLRTILLHHVAQGSYPSSGFGTTKFSAMTLNDDFIPVTPGERVHVKMAHVIAADIKASNGWIHGIDQVLMPGK